MATLDPSIFMQTKPKSAFEYLQEMAAADDMKQSRQLRGLQLLAQQGQMQDAQQARDIRNRGIAAVQGLGGAATDDQRISALRGAGDYGTADALEKSMLERQKVGAEVSKNKADAEKSQLANLHSKIDRHLQGLATVNDPGAAAQWLQSGLKDGVMDMQKASALMAQLQTMTPDQIQGWKQQMAQGGLSLKDQVEQVWKQKGYDLDVQRVGETQRHNKAQEGLTARGQNLTDARAREANDINKQAGRSQVVETPDGVMIVDKGTGLARPAATINGKPLPGKPSESTKKALTEISQQRSVIQGAIDAVVKTPSAFGLTRGAATLAGGVAESAAGRFDSDAERQARSYVFNNVSKVINERAGAAQSAQELARLRSFLPAETDNSEQIVSKLKAYQAYLNDLESGTTGSSGAAKTSPKQDFSGWKIEKAD